MGNKQINVLIFPAEGISAVELHDSLSTCVNIKLFGASSVPRHGPYVFENYICPLPFITADSFMEEFNSLIDENSIDVIFPTHDTVALFLAQRASQIHRAKVLGGDLFTASVCRSKIKIHELFSDCPWIPLRFKSASEISGFPVFVKPDEGQGTVGAFRVSSAAELPEGVFEGNLVTEFLPGDEFSVDCLTDKDGRLRYVSPRSRERTMAGVSVSGQTEVLTEEIRRMAEVINSRLHFLGLWFFQIKKDEAGAFKLMEVACRIAGTMCLTRSKGINLPMLSVYTACGYDISIFENDYSVKMDRTLISRYELGCKYSAVYIDFDDTVTLRGTVNLNVIRFLYQCHNKGVKVYLLTRHAAEIYQSLASYAISEGLFTEIIHIIDDSVKSGYISVKDSIFVDNAYKEREEVSKRLGIPVFDVDGIEFLLDWRI